MTPEQLMDATSGVAILLLAALCIRAVYRFIKGTS